MTRFDTITEKLNKLFESKTETEKDVFVKSLKQWCKLNNNDKVKLDAIKNFLADNNIF